MSAMTFTNERGEQESVPMANVTIVESNPKYKVYKAISNPSGESLMRVVYNNPGGTAMPTPVVPEPTFMTDGSDMSGDFVETPMRDDFNDQLASSMLSMKEDAPRANPAAVITFRNLRMPGAIMAEQGTALGATKQLGLTVAEGIGRYATGRVGTNVSVRDNQTLLKMAKATDWYSYVTRILYKNPVDQGAELSAEVSDVMQRSVYMFVKEWENDPSHTNLRRRVSPGADIADVVAKGQIAYDLITSRIPNPMAAQGAGSHQYDKMFRLAHDIILSMDLNVYNYYTLMQLMMDEGGNLYREFTSMYVPLDMSEVEMITEMSRQLNQEGRAYAFRTTSDDQRGLEAAELMEQAVRAYDNGMTLVTRTILTQLSARPFYYAPKSTRERSSIQGSPRDREDRMREDKIYLVNFGNNQIDNAMRNNAIWQQVRQSPTSAYVYIEGDVGNVIQNNGQLNFANAPAELTVVRSARDATPVAVLFKDGNRYRTIQSIEQTLDRAARSSDRGQNRRGRGIAARMNPMTPSGYVPWPSVQAQEEAAEKSGGVVMPNAEGRGKYFVIELHSKSALKMKRKSPSGKVKGEMRHGQSKNATKWSVGLNKLFPGHQWVQTGTLKKTGKEAPYRIRLPIEDFRPVTHPTLGYKTLDLRRDKANKKKVAAWNKLLKFYGTPKMSPSKDTHYRFVIDKKNRGTYYDGLR